MMLGARTAAWVKSGGGAPRVCRVQYLDTQPGQYVDTGVRDWTLYKISAKFQSLSNPKATTHASAFCGCRISSEEYYFTFLISEQNNNIKIVRIKSNAGLFDIKLNDPTKIAELESQISFAKVVYDGVFLGQNYTGTSFVCKNNIYFFGINNAMSWSNSAYIRFYELIVKDGEVEKYHYLPVIKDGVCCIWESVANVYLYNGGVGNFVPGPVVSDVP